MCSSGFIFVNSAIVVRSYLSRIDRSRLVPDLLHLQLCHAKGTYLPARVPVKRVREHAFRS